MDTMLKEKASFYVFYAIGLIMVILAIIFPQHGTPLFIVGAIGFLSALSETVAWGHEKQKRALKIKKIKRK